MGDDVEANDFDLGTVGTVPDAVDQTVMLFEKGQEKAARRLAATSAWRPSSRSTARRSALADGADVVVIAGQDRASS